MIYAADHPALAVPEVRVHLDLPPDLLPDDYLLLTLDLGPCESEALDEVPLDPAGAGTARLETGHAAILSVPSFIVPESRNLLIDPYQRDAGSISIRDKRPFRFDERLWRG